MSRYTFLYDDACPMCRAYTSAFDRFDVSRRRAFSEVDAARWGQLDVDRGRHEIPMLDGVTGEVRYGLDAMTWALSAKLPVLRPVLRSRTLIAALKPLYWLITYNRRVIAGTKAPAEGFDCAPDVHVGWRLAYIALAGGSAVALGLPEWMLAGFVAAGGVGVVVAKDRLSFAGQLVTVALVAAIVAAAVPGVWGVGLSAAVALWEGRRRLRRRR